jgi:hypothetical protein
MHTDVNPFPQSDAIVQSAQARGVPVISARQLLTWLDAKNASSISNIVWSNNRQSFSLQVSPSAHGLQTMVPVPAGFSVVSVKRNNVVIASAIKFVKGIQYVVFSAANGQHEVQYVQDTVAPTVVSTEPASGETGVAVDASVSVAFSEPMTPSTLTSSTFRLQTSQGATVSSTLFYDSSSFTVTLTPNANLSVGATYSIIVTGGSSGVKDLSGNALSGNVSRSFSTVSRILYSMWPENPNPEITSEADSSAVELGVKFRSSVPGYVSGVRFYKGSGNSGSHRGNLWSSTGTLLGTVLFSNETASGWQEAFFTAPIAINANTTYVISYFAPLGRYAVDGGYFMSGGMDRPPLRALSAAESVGCPLRGARAMTRMFRTERAWAGARSDAV